jgi:hypothetical protein
VPRRGRSRAPDPPHLLDMLTWQVRAEARKIKAEIGQRRVGECNKIIVDALEKLRDSSRTAIEELKGSARPHGSRTTPSHHTLPPHPPATRCHHTLPPHPATTPSHHTLPPHAATTPSHHTLPLPSRS